MTPQEKAIDLIGKYRACKDKTNSYFVLPILEDAKQCALIAVEEVLDQFIWRPSTGLSYWQEVKKEIEKL